MDIIGNKTIEGATELIGGLLRMYKDDIDKAYLKSENSLTVSLSLNFKPSETATGIDIDAKIKFVTDQVKDSLSRTVNENQMELFDAIKDGRVVIHNGPQTKEATHETTEQGTATT